MFSVAFLYSIFFLSVITSTPCNFHKLTSAYEYEHAQPFQGQQSIVPQHDQWCQTNCYSIETCDRRFQNNYVDLQLQTRHSILDGPGRHLIYNHTKYFRSTIAKQTFVTQFVMDISQTSLGISPCKVHVLDILSVGKEFKNVVIRFRLYEVVHDEVINLTQQIQNRSSLFYNGKVW